MNAVGAAVNPDGTRNFSFMPRWDQAETNRNIVLQGGCFPYQYTEGLYEGPQPPVVSFPEMVKQYMAAGGQPFKSINHYGKVTKYPSFIDSQLKRHYNISSDITLDFRQANNLKEGRNVNSYEGCPCNKRNVGNNEQYFGGPGKGSYKTLGEQY